VVTHNFQIRVQFLSGISERFGKKNAVVLQATNLDHKICTFPRKFYSWPEGKRTELQRFSYNFKL